VGRIIVIRIVSCDINKELFYPVVLDCAIIYILVKKEIR